MRDVRKILEWAVKSNASDLHLTVGLPPCIRVNGTIQLWSEFQPLTPKDVASIAESMLAFQHLELSGEHGETEFSYGLHDLGRFRCTLYKQRGSYALAIRIISPATRSIEELGLPSIVKSICERKDGLVIVTGPTGSGKSTTLAAIVEEINRTRSGVIITLEDPIEYLHTHKKCIVNQREIGSDTNSFASALRTALRSDPDVILVGEMRDPETMAIALRAAETGHLVLSTLHTRSAASTIDRVIDSFPLEGREQIRVQLASTVEAVIAQKLVPTKDERSRVLATEVLVGTPAVRNIIREGKTHMLNNIIETGSRYGMHTMEADLKRLAQEGLIDLERALV